MEIKAAYSVLYHSTNMTAAIKILKSKKFNMSSPFSGFSETELSFSNFPYLSTSRSKTNRAATVGGATFVLDGNKISHNYKILPVDFWAKSSGKKGGENEERILSKKGVLSLKYVKELHISTKAFPKSDKNFYIKEQIFDLIKYSKNAGVKIFIYDNEKEFDRLSKKVEQPYKIKEVYRKTVRPPISAANIGRDLKLKNLKLGQTIVTALSEDYFTNYGPGGYAKEYTWYGFDLQGIMRVYKRNNITPKSILDAGCADGRTVRDMRKAGLDAYGIEVADYAIDNMVESAKPYCKQMDIKNIGEFKDGAFDTIYTNALMYLTTGEIEKFLTDAHRVVGQSLYIITPFKDYPDTIPDDKYRKTLANRRWWLDTVPKFGWKYCRGTNLLFKKV